jgi:transcriptional regulator with XRE-family HTH domain
MGSHASPTVRRRRLSAELRRLRRDAGLTADAAARALDWAPSKVTRIERNEWKRPSVRDVADMLALYAARHATVPPEVRDALLQLARDSRVRGWWQDYGDVLSGPYCMFVGLEAEASEVRTVQPLLIPGLLQTPEYARAVIEGSPGRHSEAEITRLVEVRLARQELVTRACDPLRVWAVLGEAVLHQDIGGPEVMHGQAAHLLKMGGLPNVTIQIVPYSIGAWPGMYGPVTILKFPGDTDVSYVETPSGLYFAEDENVVAGSRDDHDRSIAAGLGRSQSAAAIEAAAERTAPAN